MTREWNAKVYDELPLPHVAWGKRTIERLNLAGTERVLDAGCGTGRDAEELLRRFPDVELVGIDGSSQMVEQARERFAGRPAERASFHVRDLEQPLDLEGSFDAVMSVACFHWIADHDALFANLAEVMRPGARLASDSGGEGNIAIVEAAISRVRGVPNEPKGFVGPQETKERLERHGFDVERVELRPSPVRIDDPATMERYLATICLGGYLDGMTDDEAREFTRAVREAMSEPVLDYVRLEIDALRR